MTRRECLEILVGPVSDNDLRNIDYALSPRFGVFVPELGPCNYSITPDHRHPAYMCIANLHSHCRIRVSDNEIECEPDRLYCFSPDIVHHEYIDGDFNRYFACMIEKNFFAQRASFYTPTIPRLAGTVCTLPANLPNYLVEYMSEYERDDRSTAGQMHILEERITHIIVRSLFANETANEEACCTGVIDRAIHFMHMRFFTELSIEDIAAYVSVSPSHFSRLFKRATGKSPMEFLKRLRLDKARKLLVRSSGMNLTRIAYDCGFNSSSHFTVSFHDEFGISPSQYRRKNSARRQDF